MAKFHKGFSNIKVKLIDFPKNIAEKACEFNEFGSENYYIPDLNEEGFVLKFKNGKTFPKYVFEACRISFSIEGISRICLAQLTRDNAIFCSESHGLRPLSMEFNIPYCLYEDTSIMDKLKKAQYLLEEAYIEACEKELPYPETRYLGLHAQTISVNASYTLSAFQRACYSRTNNSFCDELNYVYRKMYYELRKMMSKISKNDYEILLTLFNDDKCIDDNFYTRTAVYNGDFSVEDKYVESPAHNDWRKSGWFKELQDIEEEEPELLTLKELRLIHKYSKGNLPSTYDRSCLRVARNAIKTMEYYNEHRKD